MSETSIAPALLIAMPQLLDPNFKRAVVLLIHHDSEGTFGLVVNRPAQIPVQQLCSSLEIEWQGDVSEQLGWGGPVQPNTGWVVFGETEAEMFEDVTHVTSDIQVAGSMDALRQIAAEPPTRMRLLLGYAGWGPGQLEEELAQGAWLLAPVDAKVVFDTDEGAMWEHTVRSLGIDPATLVATPGVH